MRKAALGLLALLLCTTCLAQSIEEKPNQWLSEPETTIENSLQVQSLRAIVTIKGEGEISGRLGGKPAKIEIQSLGETPGQKILSLEENLEINGKDITPKRRIDSFGNSFALFEINETGHFTYEIEALVETNALFPKLEDFNLNEEITMFHEYKEATENMESNQDGIRTFALNRFQSQSWLESVAEATEWTNENLEYDLSYYPETYPATTVLETKKGVCDEYAVVLGSILRAKGIPARVVNGITFNPREEQSWNNHAWIEAYNPSGGWIPIDPTFGEAGTVDGTHIVRGYSPDPSQSSVSKATALQTASIEINETSLGVKVLSFEKFEKAFSLEADKIVMPAKEWHEIETVAKNNLNRIAITWVSLTTPELFTVQDRRKILVFEKGEEKKLSWKVRVEQDLDENEQLVGSYKASAIGTELKRELKVLPSEKFDEEAALKVADLVPTMQEGTLVVEITIENLGPKEAAANVSLDSFNQEFVVGAFERRTVTASVTNAQDKEYLVSVRGPGLEFEKLVTLQDEIPSIASEPPQAGPGPESFIKELSSRLFTIEAAIVAFTAIGAVAIALLLKGLLSRNF